MSFTPNPDGIRKAAEQAVLAAGPRHIAEIRRLTSGCRCEVHGATAIYVGPWPDIAFEDFCCDDLRQQVRAALAGISWISLRPAA